MDRRKYRQAARDYFRDEVCRGVFSKEEYRVPLQARRVHASAPSGQEDTRAKGATRPMEEATPVADLLSDSSSRHKVLIARPGVGKTTTLLAYALSLAEAEEGPLPVFVPLRVLDGGFADLQDLIVEGMRRFDPEAQVEDLRGSEWVLLLDGVNEWIYSGDPFTRLIAKFPDVSMVFSTRDPVTHLGEQVELMPLRPEERDAVINAFLPEDAEALCERLAGDPRLAELSLTPLLLALLCDVVRDGSALSANRSALLRASVHAHYGRYQKKATTNAHAESRVDAWLARLAHAMLMRGGLQIPWAQAEEVLTSGDDSPRDAGELLRNLSTHHLLALRTPESVEFVHPLVHEYYAAEHLRRAELPPRRILIREYLNRTLWTEPLRLYADECDDAERAACVVDAAAAVDDILAAQLVGCFPAALQRRLFDSLLRPGEPVGLRLARALAVGTDAGAEELARLIELEDQELRYRVADGLWGLPGRAIAELNTVLLEDPSLSVTNAASDNLRRHPAPVAVLLRALDREELRKGDHTSFALPHLLGALMAIDTDEAAVHVCQLARRCLPRLRGEVVSDFDLQVCAALSGRLAPKVAQALGGLLCEVDSDSRWELVQALSRTSGIFDVDAAIVAEPEVERGRFTEYCLGYPERFRVSEGCLLLVLESSKELRSVETVLTHAKECRCAGLIEWLSQRVASGGSYGWRTGRDALPHLLDLDAYAAERALRKALAAEESELRHDVAASLCRETPPELAALRPHALAIVHGAPELMVRLVRSGGPNLAAELLEHALDHPEEADLRRVVEEFWQRSDIAPHVRDFRGENKVSSHFVDPKPQPIPGALLHVFARTMLTSLDPALCEAFLERRELWCGQDVEPLVVDHLAPLVEDVVNQEEKVVSRALERLRSTSWQPSIATFVRLLEHGHLQYYRWRSPVDSDALFAALRPLIQGPDVTLAMLAFSQVREIPRGYLAEYARLLERPELTLVVATMLLHGCAYEYFPAILGHTGLVEIEKSPMTFPAQSRSVGWRSFRSALESAPKDIVEECLDIVAARAALDWEGPFLELFAKVPRLDLCERVFDGLDGDFRSKRLAEKGLRALVPCVETTEDFAIFLRPFEKPQVADLTLARILAECAGPIARTSILGLLARVMDSPLGSDDEEDLKRNLAGWWARLLGRVGTSTDGGRLIEFARRTNDAWVSQEMFRRAAEIQQRIGVYCPRYAAGAPEWTLLHLSDLHFSAEEQAERWYSALDEDLRRELGVAQLDAVVLSGDIVDRGRKVGYHGAERFLRTLTEKFRVPRERIVIVPGNHDVDRSIAEAAIRRVKGKGRRKPGASDFQVGEKYFKISDRSTYERRLEAFAAFFERSLGRQYPLNPSDQTMAWVWPEIEVAVVGLSSVVELDGRRWANAVIDDTALGRALEQLRSVPDDYLKLAVVHHPLQSPDEDRIRDPGFVDRLAVAGFSLILHGHVHKSGSDLFRYDCTAKGRRIEVVGAGTFGARSQELPTGSPWQYNLLRRSGELVRVHTRRREAENSAWKPYACWTTGAGAAVQAYFDLDLSRGGR